MEVRISEPRLDGMIPATFLAGGVKAARGSGALPSGPGGSVGSSSSRLLCSPVSAFMKATRSADSCYVSLSGLMSGSSDGLGLPPLS